MRRKLVYILILICLYCPISIFAQEESDREEHAPVPAVQRGPIIIMVVPANERYEYKMAVPASAPTAEQQQEEEKKNADYIQLRARENADYVSAKEYINKIEKGKTTKQEIYSWFGDSYKYPDAVILSRLPLFLKNNQKVIKYRYVYHKDLEGDTLDLYIVMNKETDLVDDFYCQNGRYIF